MKKSLRIFIEAIVVALLAAAFFFIPIENWIDELQGWDALIGIIMSISSLLLGIWSWEENKKERSSSFRKVQDGDYVDGDKTLTGGDYSLVAEEIEAKQVFVGGIHHHGKENNQQTESTNQQKLDLEAAEKRYYEYLINRYQNLEFKGMGMTGKIPLNMPLMELYVPLKSYREIPEYEKAERQRAVKAMVAGRELVDEEGNPKQFSDTEPILEILQNHGSLVVLGDPGSGKSTLLKWLTLVMASGEFMDFGLEHRLPILLSLSSYAREMEETGDCSLDNFLAKRFKEQVSDDLPIEELYQKALVNGHALVLLDGLDEVRNIELRQTIVNRVQNYHAMYCDVGNHFILTSRIVGYKEVRLNGKDLQEVTLVDFDNIEIELFITKWTSVIEQMAQTEELLAKQAAENEQTQLLNAIERNSGVRRLAANPLLLTILCGMKRQGVTLPERRVQLYDQYVQVLLAQWNQARNIDGITPGRNINVVQTVRLLAPLALWMHQHSAGIGRVKVQELRRKLIELFIEKEEEEPETATDLFLADVRDYSCLLVERGEGEYGFLHLTFEEYLAGVGIALAGQGNSGIIARQIGDLVSEDVWRESSLMAIAYVSLIQQLESVAGDILLSLVENYENKDKKHILLAGEALVDAGKDAIPVPVRKKVIQALILVMQGYDIPFQIRHRSGRALDDLAWVPEDLDWFMPVPAGKFVCGEDGREEEINYDFWMAKYPVTFFQYKRFISTGGYQNLRYWGKKATKWIEGQIYKSSLVWELMDRNDINLLPVIGITFYEAQAYANWMNEFYMKNSILTPVGKMEIPKGYQIRLPREVEWEYAARGNDGRKYPWGNEFRFAFANAGQTNRIVTSVAMYLDGSSPFGIMDLIGNTDEWQMSSKLLGCSLLDPINRIERYNQIKSANHSFGGIRLVISRIDDA